MHTCAHRLLQWGGGGGGEDGGVARLFWAPQSLCSIQQICLIEGVKLNLSRKPFGQDRLFSGQSGRKMCLSGTRPRRDS